MNYLYTQDNKYLLNETMDAKNGKKKPFTKDRVHEPIHI